MKIDSDNNLQRFQTGSEAGEAVEIHDFQIVSKFVLVLTLPPPPHSQSSAETFCVLSEVAKL